MSQLPEGTRRRLMKHPLGWIAAGFGAGFAPKAPALLLAKGLTGLGAAAFGAPLPLPVNTSTEAKAMP